MSRQRSGDDAARSARPGPSLKARALRLLAQREHSRAELERKLQAHADDPAALAEALDALQARGFIDEARVADSVLHRRAERLGAARVRAELQAKGLATEVVAEAVARLQDTELERAQALWQRKFGAPATDLAGRARQVRFLVARGFAADVVRRVVPRAVAGGAEDDPELAA